MTDLDYPGGVAHCDDWSTAMQIANRQAARTGRRHTVRKDCVGSRACWRAREIEGATT